MRLLLALALTTAVAAQPAPLDRLADALGGRDRIDALEAVRVTSRARVTLGDRTATATTRLTLRPDAARLDAGLGRQSVVLTPDDAFLRVGDAARDLAPAARARAEHGLWARPLVMAARRSRARAEVLAPGLLRVTPPTGAPLVVRLDESGRPALVTSEDADGRYRAVAYSDYREVGGLWVPHRTEQTTDGVRSATATVTRVETDPDLAPDLFERPVSASR